VARWARSSQHTLKNNWHKPWLCVCWKDSNFTWFKNWGGGWVLLSASPAGHHVLRKSFRGKYCNWANLRVTRNADNNPFSCLKGDILLIIISTTSKTPYLCHLRVLLHCASLAKRNHRDVWKPIIHSAIIQYTVFFQWRNQHQKKIYQKGCNCRQSFPKDSIPNIYNTSLGFFPWFDSSASLQEALKNYKKGEKDLEKSDIYFSIQI